MLIETLAERSIYHAFREEVVRRGYLPDIKLFDIENVDNTIAETENRRYEQAIQQIKTNKGFAIEVFNYASNQSYGSKNVPRIVLNTDSFMPGNLGLDPSLKYVPQEDGTFQLSKSVDMLSDFYFTIYLVANSTRTIRELHDILAHVLPRRGYIKWYEDTKLRPHSNLLIQYLSSSDISYLSEGIIEKAYRYMIPDIHEIDDRIIPDVTIAGITEIKVDTGKDTNIITVE